VESRIPNAERKDERPVRGLSLQTLVIASVASAAASFAASRIWGPGTLISAAATPVVVALVSEFLRRPVQRVSATARKLPAPQSLPAVRKHTIATAADAAGVKPDPQIAAEPYSPSGQQADPHAAIEPDVDAGTVEPTRAEAWRPRWRPALITGLVAFAIVVALYTVPDLVAGHSITGNGAATTFFGDPANVNKNPGATTTGTATSPPTTITKTTPAKTTTTTPGATQTTKTTTPANPHATTTPTTSTTPAVSPGKTTQTAPAH
jgi:hypothetical protein